jgi:hypothetical protein
MLVSILTSNSGSEGGEFSLLDLGDDVVDVGLVVELLLLREEEFDLLDQFISLLLGGLVRRVSNHTHIIHIILKLIYVRLICSATI